MLSSVGRKMRGWRGSPFWGGVGCGESARGEEGNWVRGKGEGRVRGGRGGIWGRKEGEEPEGGERELSQRRRRWQKGRMRGA